MEKVISKIFLAIFLILVIQFVYFGITTTPAMIHESDSLAYHIPIAQNLAKLDFLPPKLAQGLGFYPAGAEIILAILVFLHIPLNLFNVFGLIMLFYFARKTGKSFGLTNDMSIIFAGSVTTLQSLLRWPLTQNVDIWLAVFFLAALYLLKNPKTTISYFFKLGIALGLLIGAKYSGIIYGAILLIIFGMEALSKVNFARVIYFLIPFSLLGIFWYLRNYLLTGNPFYPANFFFFKGNPSFPATSFLTWTVVGNIIQKPSFLGKFLEALNSEFPVWWLALLLPLLGLRKKFSNEIWRLAVLGISMFFVFSLILPVWPGIEVSNLRFIYPTISVLILAIFLLFKKYNEKVAVFSLLIAVISILNIGYHPKVLVFGLLVAFYWLFLK